MGGEEQSSTKEYISTDSIVVALNIRPDSMPGVVSTLTRFHVHHRQEKTKDLSCVLHAQYSIVTQPRTLQARPSSALATTASKLCFDSPRKFYPTEQHGVAGIDYRERDGHLGAKNVLADIPTRNQFEQAGTRQSQAGDGTCRACLCFESSTGRTSQSRDRTTQELESRTTRSF